MGYRIVLRAHTARRDTAACVMLQRIFERAGHQVFIASVRNFTWVLKLWNPHLVIVQTAGSPMQVKELCPDAKIVFLDGEGYQPIFRNWATFWQTKPEHYDIIDLALLWGEATMVKMEKFIGDRDLSKAKIIGAPRFDLLDHVRENIKPESPPASIGIVGRYPSINNHSGDPAVCRLHTKENLDFTINSCHAFHIQHQLTKRILEETDLKVSIRPHPLENIQTYHRHIIPTFDERHHHRIEIDDRLDFAEWVVEQRALLSPTSTSYVEAYMLGVPFIIVDGISGLYDYNAGFSEICRDWLESAFVPSTVDEAFSMIQEATSLETKRETMDEQISHFCNYPSEEPPTVGVAREIFEMLEKSPPKLSRTKHIPYWVLKVLDLLAFKRSLRRDPTVADFNFKEGVHIPPVYIDSVLQKMNDKLPEAARVG